MRYLDHNNLNNYWLVSDLYLVDKVLKKPPPNFPPTSAHTISMKLLCQYIVLGMALKVVDDLLLSLNKDNMSMLALLDFSSAFDTFN